jgi:Recombinase
VTTATPSSSAQRGRPPSCPRDLAIRIVSQRLQGLSYGQICALLNAEGIPTPEGKPRWLRSYVDRILHTRYAQDILGNCCRLQSADAADLGPQLQPRPTDQDTHPLAVLGARSLCECAEDEPIWPGV